MSVLSRCAVCGSYPDRVKGYLGVYYKCSNPYCGTGDAVDTWNKAQETIRQLDTAAPHVTSPAPCGMAEDGATRKDAQGAAVSPCEISEHDKFKYDLADVSYCPICNVRGKESK